MSGKTRCVVTGLGLVCAVGSNVSECVDAIYSGKTGIKEVRAFDTEQCYTHKGAESDLTNEQLGSENYDRSSLLCIKAAEEAVEDSGLVLSQEDKSRIGVILGSCVGGAISIDKYYSDIKKNGSGDKQDIPKMTASAMAANVCTYFGLCGITANIVNACAAGTLSLSYACDLIRSGRADVFLAGGSDGFSSLAYAGFHGLHALAQDSCSPFNHSNGISLGEGSGVLIIESYEHAVKRGAKIYCEILGSGVSSDAYHITAPRPDGEGQMSAINKAVRNSGLDFSDIDYINAHGTGTAKNDEAEFLSLKTLFGNDPGLSVSSTKSMTGHCLGAAGSIEAVLTVKAIEQSCVPPTIGYSDEDIRFLSEKSGGIDFVANKAKSKNIDYAMSNSFAFGGNNASIIFSKKEHPTEDRTSTEPIYITGIGTVDTQKTDDKGFVAELKSADFKERNVKTAFFRKLDRFSQLQLLSGIDALSDSGIEVTADNENDIGMIIGTADGPLTEIVNFQKNVIEKGTQSGSAFLFPNTVYNAAGGYLSIFTGIKGYNVTVANGPQAGLQSVCYACDAIHNGDAKIMLAGGTDENTDVENELYGESGYVLGEGSVSMILESKDSALQRKSKIYAEIAGFATARTAVKYGTLDGSEQALGKAVAEVLGCTGLNAGDIDCVYGFKNGKKSVDDIEDRLLPELLPGIRVIEATTETGDARAASAAMQLSRAAKAIADGKINNALVLSYATGGMYTAVLVKRV